MSNEAERKKKKARQLLQAQSQGEQEQANQWKEKSKEYEAILKEAIKIITQKAKEFEKAEEDLQETKKQQIIKCGKWLEKHELAKETERISARLTKEFDGIISARHIREIATEYNWTSQAKTHTPQKEEPEENFDKNEPEQSGDLRRIAANVATEGDLDEGISQTDTFDTQIEYTIEELIEQLTGKDASAREEIKQRTKNAQLTHWSTILLKESETYIKTQAHKMTDEALTTRLENLRVLETVRNKVVEALNDVKESRKKTEKIAKR